MKRTVHAPARSAVHSEDDAGQILAAVREHHAEALGMREDIRTIGSEVRALQDFAEDLSKQTAALRVGGGGDGRPGSTSDRRALAEFARNGTIGSAYRAEMSTDSNPDGGFIVPDTIEAELYRTARDVSPMRQIARVVTISQGNTWKQDAWLDAAGAEWVGERSTRNETTTPTLTEVSIVAHELSAVPKLTNNVLQDTRVDLASELTTEVAFAFQVKEDAAFVSGNGVLKPRGILEYDKVEHTTASPSPWGKIGFVKTGLAGGFIVPTATDSPVDCLIALTSSVKAAYRTNSRWLMNRATAATIQRLKDSEGRFAWQPSTQAGTPDLLLGYPISYAEDMPDIGADTFPVAFGDFRRGYVVLDRSGIFILRNPFKETGWTRFETNKRVGGGVFDFHALKLLKIAA